MLNLAKLLWLDDECIHEYALPEAFGDRYLMVNNPVFARVRGLFVSAGFQFSREDTRLWRDYISFPLLMLQEMLDSGIVPYKDNGTTLRQAAASTPDLAIPEQLLVNVLQRNYLLHESAHCVSYRMLASRFDVSRAENTKAEYVMVAILCEAYANTVERLGASLAISGFHKVFYTANSFVECREHPCSLLRDSIRIFGLESVFLASMYSFWFINTHEDGATEEAIRKIGDAVFGGNLNDAKRVLLRILINQGFGLSKRFRSETTPFFFRYLKCEKEFQSLCQEPFDMGVLASRGIVDAIHAISAATCEALALNQDAKLDSPTDDVVLHSSAEQPA